MFTLPILTPGQGRAITRRLAKKTLIYVLSTAVTLTVVPVGAGAASPAGADPLEAAGDVLSVALPATALASTLWHDDPAGRSEFLKVLAATELVTFGLKYALDAPRPNGGRQSFPSGHTAAAFAGAAFLHRRYGLRYGAPAYALATLVGASRVTSRNHWIQDVIAGAAIGIGTNLLLTSPYPGAPVQGAWRARENGADLVVAWRF